MAEDDERTVIHVRPGIHGQIRDIASQRGVSEEEVLRQLLANTKLPPSPVERQRGLLEAAFEGQHNPKRDTRTEKPRRSRRPPPIKVGAIRNRGQLLLYSKTLIAALQDALEYDSGRHHNQPIPELRLDDPQYLQELRNLVAELKRLNDLLEKNQPRIAPQAVIMDLTKKLDKLLDSYVGALGKGAAALTVAVIAALLYEAGVGKEMIDHIWGHLKLPK